MTTQILAPSPALETLREMRQMIARWWRSIDRIILCSALCLMVIGVILCFAASPVAAARLGIGDPLHFVKKQVFFLLPALTIIIGTSLLSALTTRRLGVLLLLGAAFLMVVTLLFAPEINGAKRWLSIAGFSLQPSELMKPGFVLTAAWLLSEGTRDKSFPGGLLAFGLYAVMSCMLLMQPDYGQWLLLTAIWGVMFFVAGWSWMWIGGLGLATMGGLAAGYTYAPHVASRIDRFLNPQTGDTYQVDKALEAMQGGGFLGHDLSGKSEGVKYSLPDAHTDYIFAVAGEEFGFFLCAIILTMFALIVLRSFYRSAETESLFLQSAICGFAALIGFQAVINMGVSLNMLPSKGMTLPFISSGGSSLLASSLAIGCLLSLTRRRSSSWHSRNQML